MTGRFDPDEPRRSHLGAILRTVHTRGPTSRTLLTKQLGVNRSTIGSLTSELEELGLVREQNAAFTGRSGRPSHLVEAREDNVVVAVDLRVDRIAVAVVGLGGRVLRRRELPVQRGKHDAATVSKSVAQSVKQLLVRDRSLRCLGVGVAVPGVVRHEDGLVRLAPTLGWVDEPLAALLSHRLDDTLHVGNDANLGVLAEHLRGAAMGYHDVAYLSGSVAISGGFLVGGALLTGASGYAGEVGHLRVASDGPTCRCGATGCWEIAAGENSLLQRAGRLPGGGPEGVAEVIAAARAGEKQATQAVAEVADWCGVGIRAVVHVFNPQVIVLGGTLAQVWEAAETSVNAAVERGNLLFTRSHFSVRASALGQDASLLGAAELAFAPTLEDPQRVAADK